MASVTPKRLTTGNTVWRVQFRIDGQMRQETFPTEDGARSFGKLVDRVGGDAARRVLAARRDNAGTPTLREWTDEYLDPASGILTGIQDATRLEYTKIAERSFLPMLGELPVDAITRDDVGMWVTWQESQPAARGGTVSAKTVRNYHALLSSILAAAVERRMREENPAHRTRMTPGRKREAVFLSRAEFATLAHFIDPYYQPLVLFLAGTGARWSEATALTWGDLNLDSTPATVRVDKAWKRSKSGPPTIQHPKSARSRRTISLWPELVQALGQPERPESLLFPSRLSARQIWPSAFGRAWSAGIKAAHDVHECVEANLTPLTKTPRVHDLRHTHASWLIAAGAPLPFVQARLGHESITTTINVYGHLLPDAHLRMSEIMADTMNGVLTPRLDLETVKPVSTRGIVRS